MPLVIPNPLPNTNNNNRINNKQADHSPGFPDLGPGIEGSVILGARSVRLEGLDHRLKEAHTLPEAERGLDPRRDGV